MIKSTKRNKFRVSILAAAMCLTSVGAYAAGLGKMTVLSPLGQALRAELDITAAREELSSMTARVASPEAFRQAGLEYVPALAAIRCTIDKRPDGQPYVRVSTDRPVNDPFLAVLVELTWSSGRMVREYTLLLDPPDVFTKSAAAPITAPEAARPAATPAVAPVPKARAAAPVAERPPKAKPQAAAAAPQPATEGATRVVRSGDTLTKIAAATKPEGISLDQMLVALFQRNQDAFAGGNMNRLRAGRILAIPDAATASSISAEEARETVVAQARDFNAYRQKLAGAVAAQPVGEEAASRQAEGKIAPKVEEAAKAPATAKDKLEVSRTETGKDGKAVQGRISALEEDLVSRDKSLKEASGRIADLEKNLGDLKKLAELKSQKGAELQQQAQPVPQPAVQPAAEAAPKAAEPAPEAKPAEPVEAKPAEPAPTAEAKPVEPPAEKPVSPPPAKSAQAPVEKPTVEPGFIDENPALVYAGGGVLAVLLGYLGYSSWRRKRQVEEPPAPTTSRLSESDLMANSVFGSTGGQAVDTSASIQTDFSQANLTAIGADEGVDPVAEADVYMAYGRDAQAEEILLEALKTDPTRHAIYLKLLEIYSGRKNAKQFETVAKDFHAQTGGLGPDWDKAAVMGRVLDPANVLYAAGAAAEGQSSAATVAALAPAAEAGVPALAGAAGIAEPELVIPPSEAEKLHDTVTLPGQLGRMAAAAEATAAPQPMVLDFNLDLGTEGGAETPAPVARVPAAEHLDIDLSLPDLESAAPSAASVGPIDFEFDLEPPAAAAPTPQPTLALDLSAINLELGTPAAEGMAAGGVGEEDNADVATKLELAQAYQEMGDKEGARELLQEVLHEGSGHQQELARGRLAQLDA